MSEGPGPVARELLEVRPSGGAAPYPVLGGADAATLLLAAWQPRWRQAVVIADSNTGPLFGEPIAAALGSRLDKTVALSFPAGEANKTRQTKARLEDAMASQGVDRSACVVGVGGGVALDLAGFVAATYMRGLPHVNVATSLLAQVDAAIGGKTAVNAPAGKNIIGALHQPRAVLLPSAALRTLPPAELRNGLAEAVKSAVVGDSELFAQLERWAATTPSEPLPQELVLRCASVKAAVVSRDARDEGERQVLNFGHSAGHAIEAATEHRVPHGLAVAAGMLVEATLAQQLAGFPQEQTERLAALLRQLDLPTSPPCTFAEAAPFLRADKKRRGGRVQVVAPARIGHVSDDAEARWVVPVSLADFEVAWEAWR